MELLELIKKFAPSEKTLCRILSTAITLLFLKVAVFNTISPDLSALMLVTVIAAWFLTESIEGDE